MTDEQRQDMEYLQALTGSGTQGTQEREKARARWNAWRQQEGLAWYKLLSEQTEEAGFAADSFDGFYHLVHTPPAEDGRSLTASIVDNLSADFNYIGWACGLIVFVFLWCSLGSIELALLSFLPMAVSWIWILGIMALLGIQFNVVNVILATFIFGQGDDYTILMTEGCQYEYAYRRQMLASYKYGIVLSAAIMLAGIGSLAVARHPALFSAWGVLLHVDQYSYCIFIGFDIIIETFCRKFKKSANFFSKPLIAPLLSTSPKPSPWSRCQARSSEAGLHGWLRLPRAAYP
jgi:hypothetical protein